MSVWAIVPIKPFNRAKSRLSALLSASAREKLSRDCAERTLNVLAQMPSIERVVVVSRDPDALAMARAHGATALAEQGRPTLNAALSQAVRFACGNGAAAALIVPSDLPFLGESDIGRVTSASARDGDCVVIVPDRHERGTNVLLLRPPCTIEPAFGEDSFARHVGLAQARGVRVEIVRLGGLALDLDTADDVRLFESHDPFRARRSIRRYTDTPVARATVERLLAAATWAPSAHNRQPWRFVVLTSADDKTKLARAMGDRLRADRLADGDTPDLIEADARKSHARITSAPVVVVGCVTMCDMDRYADAKRAHAEDVMAIQSAAMAVQNLLLAAHAEGLGACWMCAPLFCADAVRGALDLPGDWQPQALITLGYPASTGKPAQRMALEDVTLWR